MNYQLNVSGHIHEEILDKICSAEELEEQLTALIEWKQKATVQLQHFRMACTLYNLCDAHAINELLAP